MSHVPVMRPLLPDADAVLPYLRRIDESRIYSNFGPLVFELEERYAARFRVSAESVVACVNATLGIQGAAAVSSASRFRCPAWTFAATPLAILGAGRDLAFDDIRSADWQLEPERAQSDDGIVPVLPFGAELNLDRWRPWSEVIVDAAASGGMAGRDLSGLEPGWAVVVSLHATKVLGSGEGAIVVFGDPDRARRFREYTVLGFAERRESEFIGTNAKMTEAAAAYALAALDAWDAERRDWERARRLVDAAEERLGLVSVCSRYPGATPYWIAQFDSPERLQQAEAALSRADIGSRRWWPTPCNRMPAFERAWGEVPVPCSAQVSATTLGLPFFRDLSSVDVDRVVSALEPVMGSGCA